MPWAGRGTGDWQNGPSGGSGEGLCLVVAFNRSSDEAKRAQRTEYLYDIAALQKRALAASQSSRRVPSQPM